MNQENEYDEFVNFYLNQTTDDFTLEENSLSLDNIIFKTTHLTKEYRKIYLLATLILIIVSLIGHFLTIFVFGQKRFRKNSSNVYLFCLAINDCLYLVTHFFEDTIRTFIYLNETNSSFILALNVIDKHMFTCRLVNYLRYVLRFISAYIIVAFTIQRVFLVYKPFSTKFKSTKSAWKTVLSITFISLVINSWVLFILEIRKDEKIIYCDVKINWSIIYFNSTLIYICVIMLVPILVIFICNSIIILQVYKTRRRNNTLQVNKTIDIKTNLDSIMNRKNAKINFIIESTDHVTGNLNVRIKPYYLNMNQIINKITDKANRSKKITKILVLISFSNAFLNLPYLDRKSVV